jgi:hypothetical protein
LFFVVKAIKRAYEVGDALGYEVEIYDGAFNG